MGGARLICFFQCYFHNFLGERDVWCTYHPTIYNTEKKSLAELNYFFLIYIEHVEKVLCGPVNVEVIG